MRLKRKKGGGLLYMKSLFILDITEFFPPANVSTLHSTVNLCLLILIIIDFGTQGLDLLYLQTGISEVGYF